MHSLALTWFGFTLLAGQLYLAGLVSYLLLLTCAATLVASRKNSGRLSDQQAPLIRFLILIPAHNEERLIPNLLKNLARLNYPRSLYAVHVVADNCDDDTAAAAALGGALVHSRQDELRKGKGYALQWLLGEIWREQIPHDAVVILDADSTVSENFLAVMSERITAGDEAVQSYYAVQNPDQSWSTSLRYAALAVLHYLRPLGRSWLGFSAGLKGNGMVLSAGIVRQQQWTASITEDIEFHMHLLLRGKRVTFAPDAVVWGEMPATLEGARSQHTRWEKGRLQMARKYIPSLLGKSLHFLRDRQIHHGFVLLDAVIEHLLPPFTVMVAFTVAGLLSAFSLLALAGGLLPAWLALANLGLSLYLLVGQAVYLFAGLKLVKAPIKIYQSLMYAPLLLAWKVWHYSTLFVKRETTGWVRTARNEG